MWGEKKGGVTVGRQGVEEEEEEEVTMDGQVSLLSFVLQLSSFSL